MRGPASLAVAPPETNISRMAAAGASPTNSLAAVSRSSPDVQVDVVDGAVLQITLNRPEKLNALTPAMYSALADACRRPSQDGSMVAIVLAGKGKAFTAGADVSGGEMSEGPLPEAPVADFMHSMVRCWRQRKFSCTLKLPLYRSTAQCRFLWQ